MTKPNIGLLGANGAGKSTIADYLVEEHGYRKLSFAEPLRELARLNERWSAFENTHTYARAKEMFPWFRQYLIDLGEGIRKYDPVYFVKALAQKITDMDPDRPWVVDDVRKQPEVNFLHDMGFRFVHVVRDDSGIEDILGREPELDVELPTQHTAIYTKSDNDAYKHWVNLMMEIGGWALGSAPVHKQPAAEESGGGSPDGGEGADVPHWCSRCESEWVRWGNFLPPSVGEARARWYADEGRRDRDEVERHGSIATLRDGEADPVRGDSPGHGGLVPDPGDGAGHVDPDRQ